MIERLFGDDRPEGCIADTFRADAAGIVEFIESAYRERLLSKEGLRELAANVERQGFISLREDQVLMLEDCLDAAIRAVLDLEEGQE